MGDLAEIHLSRSATAAALTSCSGIRSVSCASISARSPADGVPNGTCNGNPECLEHPSSRQLSEWQPRKAPRWQVRACYRQRVAVALHQEPSNKSRELSTSMPRRPGRSSAVHTADRWIVAATTATCDVS